MILMRMVVVSCFWHKLEQSGRAAGLSLSSHPEFTFYFGLHLQHSYIKRPLSFVLQIKEMHFDTRSFVS